MHPEDPKVSHMSSSPIEQFQINYEALQDRLVFKLITKDQSEYRLWLTRRIVKSLWSVFMQVLDKHEHLQSTADQDKNKIEQQFEKEQKTKQEPFAKEASKYAINMKKTPFGEIPLLVSKITVKMGKNGIPVLGLYPDSGQGFNLPLNGSILHAMLKLLREGANRGEWDLELEYSVQA
jgi:hypothetical protein